MVSVRSDVKRSGNAINLPLMLTSRPTTKGATGIVVERQPFQNSPQQRCVTLGKVFMREHAGRLIPIPFNFPSGAGFLTCQHPWLDGSGWSAVGYSQWEARPIALTAGYKPAPRLVGVTRMAFRCLGMTKQPGMKLSFRTHQFVRSRRQKSARKQPGCLYFR